MNKYWDMEPYSAIPLLVNALSGFVCMLLSTTFHLFCCASKCLIRNHALYNSIEMWFSWNCILKFRFCHSIYILRIQLWINIQMDLFWFGYVYQFNCVWSTLFIKFMLTKYLNDPKNALKKCILFALMGIFTSAPVFHLITYQ